MQAHRPPLYPLVGTSLATQESVPAAFAIARRRPRMTRGWPSVAASLGGDTDTIAAMAGAIAGACHGAGSVPAGARGHRGRVNGLRPDALATGLLRGAGPGGR